MLQTLYYNITSNAAAMFQYMYNNVTKLCCCNVTLYVLLLQSYAAAMLHYMYYCYKAMLLQCYIICIAVTKLCCCNVTLYVLLLQANTAAMLHYMYYCYNTAAMLHYMYYCYKLILLQCYESCIVMSLTTSCSYNCYKSYTASVLQKLY